MSINTRALKSHTRCLSAGQVPTGQTNFLVVMSLRPACFIQPSRKGPGQGSMLAALEASINTLLNFLEADSGFNEPSGEVHARSRSMHSTHPPDLVNLRMIQNHSSRQTTAIYTYSAHCFKSRAQSLIPFPMKRQWM